MSRTLTAGVLALQGGVAEHARVLESLGARVTLVRRASDLTGSDGTRVDAIVLPGGESSTQDRLLRLLDLFEPLRQAIEAGLPTLGTCAGLIALARTVVDPAPGQGSLGLLDVRVRRNALGAQVASAESEFQVAASDVHGLGSAGSVRGALIRAPQIVEVGPKARAIVTHQGRVLGATSLHSEGDTPRDPAHGTLPLGQITGVSFHPELIPDPALHRALLAQAAPRILPRVLTTV